MTLNSTATTLIIGIPSLAVATATYVFSTRAHRQQMAAAAAREDAAHVTADAEAYQMAKTLWEASITEMRQQVTDARAEVAQVREELRQAQEAITELQAQITALRGGGHGVTG